MTYITPAKSGLCTATGAAKAAAITLGAMCGARPATINSRSQLAPHSTIGAETERSSAPSTSQDNLNVKVKRVVLNALIGSRFPCAVFSIEIGESSFLLLPVIGQGKLLFEPLTQVLQRINTNVDSKSRRGQTVVGNARTLEAFKPRIRSHSIPEDSAVFRPTLESPA